MLNQSSFCISSREDILVFLTGQEEIEAVVKNVREMSKELTSGKCAPYKKKKKNNKKKKRKKKK